jgi:hypothetical protein
MLKRRLTTLVVLVACLSSVSRALPEPLVLIDDGQSNVSIVVVGDKPTRLYGYRTVETYAARKLQEAFEAATGVRPATGPLDGLPEIRLGTTDAFAAAGVEIPSDQTSIFRAGDNISIVGAEPREVMWAAMDFSEQVLNVTWPAYDSGPMLEGPTRTTVTVDQLHVTREQPDFDFRGLHIGGEVDGPHYENRLVAWMSHNRLNYKATLPYHMNSVAGRLAARGIDPDGGQHTFHWLVPCDDYFDSHPEYFPEIGGKRQCSGSNSVNMQICVSQPGVAQVIIDKARELFATYPTLKTFGIIPNDGSYGWCQNPDCLAWDGAQEGTAIYSNRLIRLVNTVADALAAEYPDKMFLTLAYDNYREPPDIGLSPNVAIRLTTTGRNFLKKLNDPTDPSNALIMRQLQGWLNKARHVTLYEYYYFSGVDYAPSPIARTLCEEYPELLEAGLKGVVAETLPWHWQSLRLPAYAMARCGWDTSLGYDDLLNDYSSKIYGPAAASMKSYHTLYETTLRNTISSLAMYSSAYQLFPAALTDVMGTLQHHLDDAATAASGGSQGNTDAVQAEQEIFDKLKSISIDPATIPGIGENLVSNPGAERGSLGWSAQRIQGGAYTIDTPSGSGHTGDKSFRVIYREGSTNKGRWGKSNIPITPGKKYTLRLWVKADCAVSYGRIGLYQASGDYDIYVSWENSDDEWMQLVVPEFNAVNSHAFIFLEMYGLGKGDEVYFDDVFFAELPPDADRVRPTSISESATGSASFQLAANAPNPFNPVTEIRFTLPAPTLAKLTVYNLQGQQVRVLENGFLEAGVHRATWDGTDTLGNNLATGVYFAQLSAGPRSQVRKMLLLR